VINTENPQSIIDKLDMLSTSEAAGLVGVSDSYIRRLCRQRRLPHFAAEKGYYIPRAALLEFFKKS